MTKLTAAAKLREQRQYSWSRREIMKHAGDRNIGWPYRANIRRMSLTDRRRIYRMIPNPP